MSISCTTIQNLFLLSKSRQVCESIFFQRRPIRRSVQWQKFKKGLQVETSSHIENIFTLAHNNIKKEMSILHFDHVHIINITCLIIINIIMTIFNISTLIIRAARDSGAKGDCRRLQRGCPLSIFNMPLFNSPWFQLNVYNCPLLISCVQVLDRPLPALIKHIFHFAAFWKIVLLFGVKCFSPDCLWLIVALFLSSSRMIFFHPVCSSCSLEAPGSWPGYLTANPHFKENTKQTPGIQMYKWTFVTQFSPPPQMKDLKEKFCKTSGVHFRLMCSHRELTKDHVLTSAYVKIFRTVTRNAENKSVWRKKNCSWLPLNKHAMNMTRCMVI